MGFMYYQGNGVAQDHVEALRWYQLAAAQGHPIALYEVAFCQSSAMELVKTGQKPFDGTGSQKQRVTIAL